MPAAAADFLELFRQGVEEWLVSGKSVDDGHGFALAASLFETELSRQLGRYWLLDRLFVLTRVRRSGLGRVGKLAVAPCSRRRVANPHVGSDASTVRRAASDVEFAGNDRGCW